MMWKQNKKLAESLGESQYCAKLKASALILAPALLLAANSAAFAHNVVSGVYADGMTIEGEIGFSSGDMATAGLAVEVFNESGEKLGETTLLDGGAFVYQADTVQKHIFKVNLSSGHVAEMVIDADELSAVASPVSLMQSVVKAQKSKAAGDSNANVAAGVGGDSNTGIASGADADADVNAGAASGVGADSSANGIVTIAPGVTVAELQSMIRSTVAQQVRPLQKELRAYKEKVMFRDIAGGLGFIFGLFGVAAWMASNRKENKS